MSQRNAINHRLHALPTTTIYKRQRLQALTAKLLPVTTGGTPGAEVVFFTHEKPVLEPFTRRHLALVCLAIGNRSRLASTHGIELATHSAALMTKASASLTGESGEKLDDFGAHWLLLLARARTGESELHELWSDEIVVRSGELTIVVGGDMTGKHLYNGLPGEFHGDGLNGGTAYVLHAGDVAYIRAGIPHWMKVDPAKPATVLIYKEREH